MYLHKKSTWYDTKSVMTMDWFRMGAGGFVWVWWGSGGAPGGAGKQVN